MLGQISPFLIDSISIIVLFGFFSILVHKVLWARGFFQIPSSPYDPRKWTLKETLICFSIYYLCNYLLTPLVAQFIIGVLYYFTPSPFENKIYLMAFLQSLNFFLILTCLTIYISFLPLSRFKGIWKDKYTKAHHSYFYDIFMGILTWFIAFPVIITLNQLLELFNRYILNKQEIDQVAVTVLKNSSSSWGSLLLALFIIIISAPLIEEFLFRGCLQNFLRPHIGRKYSILLTSILFGLMHYSSSQGVSNLPLITSLITFSVYLGFVYEKTRSLISSVFLHATFNAISVIRILSM